MSDEQTDPQESPEVVAERAARRAEIDAALAGQPQPEEPEAATPESVAADPLAADPRVHIGNWGGWKNYECNVCRTPTGERQFAWLDPADLVAHLSEYHR